jgi:hypothetical protein
MSLREDLANELGNVKVDFSGSIVTSDERDAFGGYYAKRRDIYWLNAERKLNALTIPIKLKYADKSLSIEQSNLNSFFAQKNRARSLSRISPVSTYENVMAILAGTDITSFDHFINQVRIHRNEVVEYIRSRTENFSSASFFAICSEEESAEFTKLLLQIREAEDEQAKAGAEQALKEWKQENQGKAKPLGLQDFPWFKYRPSPAADLRTAISDLATLFIMNMVLFGMCFTAFARYDVR